MKQPERKKNYERTTAGLREMLFDTIVDVREGKMGGADAKAVATLSQSMIQTLDIELRVREAAAQHDPDSVGALTLAPPTITLLPRG